MTEIMSDYQKLSGKNVYFLTGVDEHGDKIVKAASADNKSPKEYVDMISGEFQKIWKELDIKNNDFIRTTEKRHQKIVQEVLQKLFEKGDIYLSSYEGNYCYGCERYLTQKELTEDGKCPDHQVTPEKITEENYFFKLQKYLPLWEEILTKNPDLIKPEQYYKEIIGTIHELKKQGEDLSITRPASRLTWGIKVPFDDNYVTYVWFDALLNYVSSLKSKSEETFLQYWKEARHVIAKDILKPHGIYWPAMLLSADIPLFKNLYVHGYWLGLNDLKMSKSLANAFNPMELINDIGIDSFKYFLSREMIFGHDSRFSLEILQNRINLDLSNNLGNLVQRTLSMIKKYTNGKIPNPDYTLDEYLKIDNMITESSANYHRLMDSFQFSKALESIFTVITELNKLIEENKPWEMSKQNSPKLLPFLRLLLDGMGVSMYYLKPFLSQKFLVFQGISGLESKLNFPETTKDVKFGATLPDSWEILFPRLDLGSVE
jgi:methionyl-tRNA synthetase